MSVLHSLFANITIYTFYGWDKIVSYYWLSKQLENERKVKEVSKQIVWDYDLKMLNSTVNRIYALVTISKANGFYFLINWFIFSSNFSH